ncbi:hypothetical protein M406DRAFT_295403 [Cryphonectria parasitica EP155]|uniref:Uncharacterized protein n=1 Tax=Cryphonectria parasitica (strain ATCC 38755 / EP155) TaxID=660469 RepID=A0A9P5CL72_CRYP1|nr:uncharacterized protein M406DRAFT_295403 [Cryphonectria parasitica EP155]KAF3761721.1 hypothetical protein M406DRAFT_295403 [Cryphonectria parasitica EP155]
MENNFSTDNPIIKRGLPNAVVYDLSEEGQVTITLPVGSTWTSGLHWHEDHVEYLRVLKGSVRVTIGDQTLTISAEGEGDGDEVAQVKVDRNVWHEWGRADTYADQEVVVVERTEPEDGLKAVFFWNLNGVILRGAGFVCPPYMSAWVHGVLVDAWVTLGLFVVFRELDNFPVFLDVPRAFSTRGFPFARGTLGYGLLWGVDWFVSHFVLLIAYLVAFVFGIPSVRAEFTPRTVQDRWKMTWHGRGKESKTA